jgi:hypothetical protein
MPHGAARDSARPRSHPEGNGIAYFFLPFAGLAAGAAGSAGLAAAALASSSAFRAAAVA